MKKYVINDSFGLDNLAVVEAPEPKPGPGEVVVRMLAASLNFRDLMTVKGLYNPRQPLPLTPLSDGAGEVVKTGEGVTRVKEGDRVCTSFFQRWIKGEPSREEARSTLGGPLDGVLAEYVTLGQEGVAGIPDHLSCEEAACLPCAGVTAWNALVARGSVKPGDAVLTLGTGGVSTFALQFAKLAGARVIATSSSDEKLDRARELGADETVNYKQNPDWPGIVREMTGGEGVDHVIEVGGAGTLERSLKACRMGGRVSVIGVLAGTSSELNVRLILMNAITVQGIFVGPRKVLEDMNRAVALSGMRPVVDKVFPFGRAREAMEYMASGRHRGKVVIRIA